MKTKQTKKGKVFIPETEELLIGMIVGGMKSNGLPEIICNDVQKALTQYYGETRREETGFYRERLKKHE